MYFGNSALTGNNLLGYYITKCSFDEKNPPNAYIYKFLMKRKLYTLFGKLFDVFAFKTY